MAAVRASAHPLEYGGDPRPDSQQVRVRTFPPLARVVALTLGFNVVFAAFLVWRPFPSATMHGVGDVVFTVAIVGMAGLWLLARPAAHVHHSRPHGIVPPLLSAGVLLGAITAGLYGYNDLVLHRTISTFSAADLAFVVAHLCALPTLLLFPSHKTRGLPRINFLLDGLLVLAAAVTFGGYYLIPLIAKSHLTPLGNLSQAAYPVSDLFMIICLLLLISQLSSPTMRTTASLLSLGLLTLVINDSVFVYLRLTGGYRDASPLDIGWLLGATFVGLSALAYQMTFNQPRAPEARTDDAFEDADSPMIRLWRSLVPYALVFAVIGFALYVVHDVGNPNRWPVVWAAVAVVLVALVRQLLTIVDSSRLTDQLNEAYRAAVSHAKRVDVLNAELETARSAVEARNVELAQTNVRLEKLATRDPLTGLANRTLFAERVQGEIAAAKRSKKNLVVGLIDLDAFKEINDTFGHQVGDHMLQHVAQRLQHLLRESDVVARLGGDEFAFALTRITARDARVLAGELLSVINQPIWLEGRVLETRASLGLAVYPNDGDDSIALLRRADVAMYHAKRSNTGYAFYSSEVDHYTASQVSLVAELRMAIDEDQLLLHYQPKIDLATGEIAGWEGLVRWQHPEHGYMPPMEFVPMAERTGLVVPLTRWALRAARDQWLSWYPDGAPTRIAINLSPRNLIGDEIVDQMMELAEDGRHSLEWLQLEITEGFLIADPDHALDLLRRLQALGVQIAIDDFGIGWSSFGQLKRLPVDEIKIDPSFVMDMGSSHEDAVIVHTIVDLAHNLGLRVTAEGVETRSTLDALRLMGCDTAQGYFFGRPAPASQISIRHASIVAELSSKHQRLNAG